VLIAPTGALKFVIEVGERATGGSPWPVSVIVCGLFGASSVTLSVAVLVPDALGVKVTESGQLDVAGTAEGATGQALVTPKSLLLAPAIVTEET